ncbi:hypothetical protein DFH06DRAFT_1224292 [Mycena polygramma]|nr:hypothetical protein DFH06DRAFT_1224292 [Mycena polygramma]
MYLDLFIASVALITHCYIFSPVVVVGINAPIWSLLIFALRPGSRKAWFADRLIFVLQLPYSPGFIAGLDAAAAHDAVWIY